MHLRAFAPGTSPRKRAKPPCLATESFPNFFTGSDKHGDSKMRNRDLVSDGFLALTAAGIFLLWSSLIAYAFA